MRVKIKPLSVNQCWQGKRFKTKEYKAYESEMMSLLKDVELTEPPYEVQYHFGFSSKASDLDNPVKPLQDILQKRYGFNDRDIYKMTVSKEIVNKGDEYLSFSINSIK